MFIIICPSNISSSVWYCLGQYFSSFQVLEEYSEKSQEFYSSKIFGDQITDLKHSRLRQFGGTSGHWGGWSKPMENYNLSKWGIEYNQLEKYSNQTCKILNIK